MSKRSSKAARRARRREERAHWQALAREGEIHERVDLDSLEMTSVFMLAGGGQHLEGIRWEAFDASGRRIEKSQAVPGILGITRDKAAKLLAAAETARAVKAVREALADTRRAKAAAKLLAAWKRGSMTWHRQDAINAKPPKQGDKDQPALIQNLRSVLVGTQPEDAKAPGEESRELWVCHRDVAGRYVLGTETWDGSVNEDGERIGVEWEPLFVTDKQGVRHTQYFHDEKTAQAAFMLAIAQGDALDGRDPGKVARRADRLRAWSRKDHDPETGEAKRDEDGAFVYVDEKERAAAYRRAKEARKKKRVKKRKRVVDLPA